MRMYDARQTVSKKNIHRWMVPTTPQGAGYLCTMLAGMRAAPVRRLGKSDGPAIELDVKIGRRSQSDCEGVG
jgi:hypothetical protein